jgi:hypothetical protein
VPQVGHAVAAVIRPSAAAGPGVSRVLPRIGRARRLTRPFITAQTRHAPLVTKPGTGNRFYVANSRTVVTVDDGGRERNGFYELAD